MKAIEQIFTKEDVINFGRMIYAIDKNLLGGEKGVQTCFEELFCNEKTGTIIPPNQIMNKVLEFEKRRMIDCAVISFNGQVFVGFPIEKQYFLNRFLEGN